MKSEHCKHYSVFLIVVSLHISLKLTVKCSITDHFEVLEKTPERILIRCGDSPLNSGVRDSDGLFEIGVKIIEEPVIGWTGTLGAKERVVEFSLKRFVFSFP